MSSKKTLARRAGWLYLLLAVPAPFALMYVPSLLYVRGDATATAANIASHELLFRTSILAGFFCDVVFLAVGVALYRLFRDVSRGAAMFLLVLVISAASAGFLNRVNQLGALIALSGADFLSPFSRAQLDALAYFFLRLHSHGLNAIAAFWGLWLLPLGLLVWRSRFIPKILGVLLIVNGFGYLFDSVTFVMFPDLLPVVSRLTLPLKFAGELPFLFWLLIKGVREEQPGAMTLTPNAPLGGVS